MRIRPRFPINIFFQGGLFSAAAGLSSDLKVLRVFRGTSGGGQAAGGAAAVI